MYMYIVIIHLYVGTSSLQSASFMDVRAPIQCPVYVLQCICIGSKSHRNREKVLDDEKDQRYFMQRRTRNLDIQSTDGDGLHGMTGTYSDQNYFTYFFQIYLYLHIVTCIIKI